MITVLYNVLLKQSKKLTQPQQNERPALEVRGQGGY